MPAPTTVTLYRGIFPLLLERRKQVRTIVGAALAAPASGGTWPPRLEPLALRLEDLVGGQPAGEGQETRVSDHPVGGAKAAAAHRPVALQHLDGFEQPEAPALAQ